jgi:hypothetical protein
LVENSAFGRPSTSSEKLRFCFSDDWPVIFRPLGIRLGGWSTVSRPAETSWLEPELASAKLDPNERPRESVGFPTPGVPHGLRIGSG